MFLPGYYKYIHWRVARAERLGDDARAERIVSRAARRRPSDCALRHLWANVLITRRRFAEAESVIGQASERCSEDYQLQCVLPEVLHRQGKRQEAERLCLSLRKKEPAEGQAWYILAALAVDAGKYDKALSLVHEEAARALSAQTRSNAVSIALRAGEMQLAEDLARRAAQDARRDPAMHVLLAVLLEGTDDAEAARQWRLAERYRRRIPDEMYRGDVEHYRSLIQEFGSKPNAPSDQQ